MAGRRSIRASILVCALLSACATPLLGASHDFPVAEHARVLVNEATVPPEGALDFCQRDPAECGAKIPSGLEGFAWAVGAASSISSQPANDRSLFHVLLLTHLEGGHPQADRIEVALDKRRWRELREANSRVNRAIDPSSDLQVYGVAEYWALPLTSSEGRSERRGDCDDYALEKRHWLIEAGWPPASLAMAVSIAPGYGLHAVLIAQTDHGDFVLDNLEREPRPVESMPYVWVSRQSGPTLAAWATASVSPPNRPIDPKPGPAPQSDGSAEHTASAEASADEPKVEPRAAMPGAAFETPFWETPEEQLVATATAEVPLY